MVELTEEQNKHIDSIRWLIDGPHGTGRTVLLAVVFIEKAIQNSGMAIPYFNHNGFNPYEIREMAETINIIATDMCIKIDINITNKYIIHNTKWRNL